MSGIRFYPRSNFCYKTDIDVAANVPADNKEYNRNVILALNIN